jgi:branched-chain amino acid transport system substrate-binding protein
MKIGLICSCSGAFGAPLVAAEDVYKAWANATNAAGGIQGHPVQLVSMNDGGTPGTAITDINSMISQHVVAIADMSDADEAWESIVQQAQVPVVGVETTDAPFYKNPDFYPEAQTGDSLIYASADVAKVAGAKSLEFFYCAESPSCGADVPLVKSAGQQLGLSTSSAAVSLTAPNYTAQCVAADQAHVDALLLATGAPQIVRFGSNCSQQGYNPTYVVEGPVFNEDLFDNAAGLKESLWAPFSTLPYFSTEPEVAAMTDAVNKYYPGLIQNSNVWVENSVLSWVSGVLLQHGAQAGGLKASDTPSAAEVVKGLESLHGDTLNGWSPPLTFTAGQPHSVDCWFTLQVKNGNASLIDGGKTTCESSPSS